MRLKDLLGKSPSELTLDEMTQKIEELRASYIKSLGSPKRGEVILSSRSKGFKSKKKDSINLSQILQVLGDKLDKETIDDIRKGLG